MWWLISLFACSSGGDDTGTGDDVTCDHGDVNRDFGFMGIDVNTENALPHHVSFSVKLTASAPLALSCILDSDTAEVHQLGSDQAICHELDLHGLLPDQDYTCSLTSLEVTEEVRVRTAEQVAHIPETSVAEHDESRRTGAYTLVSHLEKTAEPNQLKLLILDPEGRVRWFHFLDPGHAGDLDHQFLEDEHIFYGGASGIPPSIVTLSGKMEWVAPGPSTEGRTHHHMELLDDGDVLMLSSIRNTDEIGEFTGFAVEKVDLYANTVRLYMYRSNKATMQQPQK